ncbi:MAG: glycosyltransferase [Lentisphaeria bacterium]|nr:glycosyltransferase [Lentisphaeria bacterium]
MRKTLESIVTQTAWFNGETEIVISDNASTDNTSAVIDEYQNRYPVFIRSVRHNQPIDPHDNFEAAMRLGKGEYLKLNNDTLLCSANALAEYLAILRRYCSLLRTAVWQLPTQYQKPFNVRI